MSATYDHRDPYRQGPLRRLASESAIPHLLRRRARWFGARLRHGNRG